MCCGELRGRGGILGRPVAPVERPRKRVRGERLVEGCVPGTDEPPDPVVVELFVAACLGDDQVLADAEVCRGAPGADALGNSIDVRADRAWEPAWARPLTWWGERAGECLLLSVPLEVERGLRHLAVQAGPGETLDALEPVVLGRTVRPVGAQSVPLPVLLVVV